MDSPTTNEPIASLSIDEFCERYGFARSHYYVLRAKGQGPAEVVVGERRIRITLAAVDEWEKSRTRQPTTAPTPPAETVRTSRAKKKPAA